ncbi:MAG TPA: DUF3137 domain-containing protein [Bacteroidia bacterium]|jgi:hypothetical protein|nr:DUF3137 domain-containing protein [Bacteroidia bacterium]
MNVENIAYQAYCTAIALRLKHFEELRKQIRMRNKRSLILVLPVFLGVICMFTLKGSILTGALVVCTLIVLGLVTFFFVLPNPADTIEEDFKNEIIRGMFKSLDPTWKYNSMDGITAKSFLDSDLYHQDKLSKLEEFDHVFGNYHGSPFSIALIKASESVTRGYGVNRLRNSEILTSNFFGLCYFIWSSKAFNSTLLLFSDRWAGAADELDENERKNELEIAKNPKFTRCKSGTELFSPVFRCYSTEPPLANTFLDERMCAARLDLRTRFPGCLSVSFIGHHVCIHLCGEKDFLPFSLNKPMDQSLLDAYLQEFLVKFLVVRNFMG